MSAAECVPGSVSGSFGSSLRFVRLLAFPLLVVLGVFAARDDAWAGAAARTWDTCYDARDIKVRVQSCTLVIMADRSNPEAWRARAIAWIAARKPRRAVEDFDEAIKRDAHFAAALRGRAEARYLLGEREAAIADARLATEADPRDGANHAYLAHLLDDVDDDAAFAAVERALALQSDSALGLWVRARLHCKKGDVSTAHADFDRLHAAAPRYARGWGDRAMCDLGYGDAAAALPSIDRALAISPSPEFRNVRARILLALGRLPEALDEADAAVRASPTPAIVSTRAVVLEKLGRVEAAIADCRYVLARTPDDTEIVEALARLQPKPGAGVSP